MSSGITYRWHDPDADHPGDAASDILSTPLGAAPGTTFAYRGANTYLLSRIIHACSGQDLRDFLLPRPFTPLGIRNPQWLRCPLGYSLGAVGLHLRTEEIARLCCTLLDDGRYGGQQLVPAEYVASVIADSVPTGGHVATGARAPHPDNARYGRQVWLCNRDAAWRMDGIYGQLSIVLPRQQACVTTTAHYRGADHRHPRRHLVRHSARAGMTDTRSTSSPLRGRAGLRRCVCIAPSCGRRIFRGGRRSTVDPEPMVRVSCR